MTVWPGARESAQARETKAPQAQATIPVSTTPRFQQPGQVRPARPSFEEPAVPHGSRLRQNDIREMPSEHRRTGLGP